MNPGDGLDALFSGQLHRDWTERDTRSYAVAGLSVVAVALTVLAGVWAATHANGLAWLVLGGIAVVSLAAAGAVVCVARRQRSP